MSSKDLVAGVDCSTQSTKVVIVDVGSGEIVASGSASHQVTGDDGARETDPDQWWSALREALASTGQAASVGALAIAGQQHGLVVTGSDGNPLRPAVLWNDTRSADDAQRLVEALGGPNAWAERIGSVPLASFTVTSWAWLMRNEPDVARRAAAIRLPHDEVTYRLTGHSTTDRGDASGTGWWSTADEAYNDDVLSLEAVQIDPDMLPRVIGPREVAGTVSSAAGNELGLGDDVLVAPGTGDNMAGALGLGLELGQAAMSLGTSGTVYARSDRRPADESGVVAGFADATGGFLPLACTLNATLAVDQTAAWLRLERDQVQPARGVVAMPFLDGERTPNYPRAAGTISGLRHDTTREQILQATYDGAIVSLLDALDRVEEQCGISSAAPLLLTGGGAKGAVWRDTVQRLSGRAIRIPDTGEAVAVGAAVQAAAIATGEEFAVIQQRWGLGQGRDVDAVEADTETLERHRSVRESAQELNNPASDG